MPAGDTTRPPPRPIIASARRLLLAGAILLLAPRLLPAQSNPPQAPPLRVDVRLVNVDVAVMDVEGSFIPHLRPESFRLREDGEPQTLSHFAPVQARVRIALLVEASPAVFLIRRDHLAAAYHLLAGLRAEDEVALLTYARGARVEVGFTAQKERVQRQLETLGRFGLGMAEVHLRDAVANTLEWLGSPPVRTAVVLIGTGLDSGSIINQELLRRRLGSSQVTFFTVATGSLLRGAPESGRKKKSRSRPKPRTTPDALFAEADRRLRALCEATAGQAYFPRSDAELPGIYTQIAQRLRNLYSLGYYPSDRAQDGRYRTISVELVDAAGARLSLRDPKGKRIDYRVFARPGYFAPSQ